jgi:hypothetical protein
MERMPSWMPASVPERMECGVGSKVAPGREGVRIYSDVTDASVVRERMGAGRSVIKSRMIG